MSSTASYRRFLGAAAERRPQWALILGSGLGDVGDTLENATKLPFLEVPGMAAAGVPGHRGNLILGAWAGVSVLVFSGRLHYYEGHGWRRASEPVHVAHALGATNLIATNAAGGIRADLTPGTMMAIEDHLEWTRPHWWREPGPGGLGGSRPSPYDADLRRRLRAVAADLELPLATGVYAQVTGPCYETKAEIRALRQCGADVVGMSTAHEIRVAQALGLRCAAISCVTNRAAGLSDGPIHHGEVLDVTARFRERLARLLRAFLAGAAATVQNPP